MKLSVRTLTESDYEILTVSWWKAWKAWPNHPSQKKCYLRQWNRWNNGRNPKVKSYSSWIFISGVILN